MKPDVTPADELDLEWKNPDIDGLVDFLVKDKGFKCVHLVTALVCPQLTDPRFSEERVRKGGEKLAKFLNAKQQGRLDGFFSVKPKTSPKKSKPEEKEKGKGRGTKRKVCSPLITIYLKTAVEEMRTGG